MGDVASFLSLGVGFLGFRRDIPNAGEPNGKMIKTCKLHVSMESCRGL